MGKSEAQKRAEAVIRAAGGKKMPVQSIINRRPTFNMTEAVKKENDNKKG